MGAQIEVCQAGSCRAAGSEAVLREIEELAKDYPCSVRPSGCVGACSQAPNAVTVEPDGSETLHTRLVTVDKSVAVVEAATGKAPNIEDPAMWERLGAARRMRMRRLAKEEKRWNAAMSGMNEQIAKTTDLDDRMELETELCELLVSAGRWELAAELLTQIKATTDAMDSPDPQIILSLAEVLGKLKRVDAIKVLQEEVWRVFAGQRFARLREQVSARLMKHKIEAGEAKPAHRIDGYSQWTLKTVTPKSGHSALFQFESKDMKRGTPFPRGRQVLSPHKTWHTTLLAEVGANAEGPLPWIERDYTPISTWSEWEKGKCDILIKVYPDGAATSWLHKQSIGASVWLSQPKKTMNVPSLTLDNRILSNEELKHNSVLLIVAGTGIVVAAQVLHHADPRTCFGTGNPRNPPTIKSPISLIYACRSDDVLMREDIARWCDASKQGRMERCVLAVSGSGHNDALPFPDYSAPAAADGSSVSEDLSTLASLPNVATAEGRVTADMIQRELTLHHARGSFRVVVSGPESFNSAVKGMLAASGVPENAVTILSA